jgi:site-specific DNA-methyltransferase (adenine-specific)
MSRYSLRTGDILKIKIPECQCVVTSPPYFNLRDYGHEDQLGQEKSVQEYVDNLVKVFARIRKQMPDTGTLFLNLGDRYKNVRLLGTPWRVVLALVDDGWILKNDIIWHRNRIMPENAKNRFVNSDKEYVFFFTLKPRGYTFNFEAVREPAIWAKDPRAGKGRHVYNEARGDKAHTAAVSIAADGLRLKRSVWTIETAQGKNHHATFPEKLPEICILAGSNEGDRVLDPFSGTGTTGVAAIKHKRLYTGVDISSEFTKIARERLTSY